MSFGAGATGSGRETGKALVAERQNVERARHQRKAGDDDQRAFSSAKVTGAPLSDAMPETRRPTVSGRAWMPATSPASSPETTMAPTDLFILRDMSGHVRHYDGPEFIPKAVKDRIATTGARTAFIEHGSPWETGYCDSFNSKLRDELLRS